VFGLSLSEIGLALGLIAGLVGGSSVYLSGRISDRLSVRDRRWVFWLPMWGALASLPFSVLCYLADGAALAIGGIALATAFNHLYSALGHAQIQSLAKPGMRATLSALMLFAANLVGFGLGPVLVGGLSEALGGGDQLRWALLILVAGMPWAAIHYALGARTYLRDLEAKNTP